MASASASQSSGPSSSCRLNSVERRKLVLLGQLPVDFLRLSVPVTSEQSVTAHSQQSENSQQQSANVQYGVSNPRVIPVTPSSIAQHNLVQAQAFYSFVPPNTRGRISITIVEAKLAKNYGLVRMDPYCRIRVGNAVFETPTDIRGGRAPKWNRIINAYLPHGVESIYVQVYDERAFSNDECVAWSHVILPNGIFSGEVIDDWYQLSGQQGDGREGVLNLIISFQPVQQSQEVQPNRITQDQHQQPTVHESVNEADVKELHNMFQSVDEDVIRCVLEEKRGDKESAVTAILEITADQ
uniref:CUE domain-containing protein n=1 Tax=Syphacia muris TaxID=451379 RepID=A0A0N5A7S2_9BILA